MTAGVDTRTGARAFTLDDLVRDAWSGRIRVPHFQRDFKWARDDVIQLMDSIHRGYPVGSLLLWERSAPAERLTLGGLVIDAPEMGNALWVVDGQQRVVTLANVLSNDRPVDPKFSLGFDLRADRIVPLPTAEDPLVVPLPIIFDLSRVLTWFAERAEANEYRDAAFGLARDLRQFAIPAYQVVQNDIQVLQEIFDRMNNSGKRLSRAEVFSALTAGTEEQAEHRLTIGRIGAHIDSAGFGRIDPDTILQCILARRGPDIQREIRWEFDPPRRRGQVDFPNEDRDEAFSRGEDALVQAVAFVRNAGVPHYTLLPYRYLLVVLTRFLALHPDPDPAELRLLHRWFWRAAVAGPAVAKGSTTGVTRVLCGKVSARSSWDSVRDLLEVIGESPVGIPDLRRFKTNEASAKIVLCSLWSLNPRRPETGAEYDPVDIAEATDGSNTAAEAVRPVFARRLVPGERNLWAANRVLMPGLIEATPSISGLLQREPASLTDGVTWRQVLDSHAIDVSTEQAILDEEVSDFVDLRQTNLRGVLQRFLQSKCEWGFENTPPLSDLELEDLTDDDDAD